MSLYDQAKAKADKLPAREEQQNLISYATTHINVERDLRDLAAAIEKAYPDMELAEAAMDGAGRSVTGEAAVPLAVAQLDGRKTVASITVYASGSVSWMNCQPVPFGAAAKAAQAEAEAEAKAA